MAVNNILSYYIEGANADQPMSLVYAFFSAGLVGLLLMNIEKTAENQFVQECLERKVKKQGMERFVFILINRFLHEPTKQARLTFKVYSKIISKNIERYREIEERLCEDHQWSNREEVYHFLCVLIESCLEENSSVILKTLKCYLLCYLGQKSFGLHQSLELQEERLGIADEFMLYEFKINQNVFGNERAEKFSLEFVKYYRFHEELGELEELTELCAQNNLEYWEELCEGDPSIAKLRNLATLYNSYEARIAQQYAKVIAVFPQNLYSTTLYLKFLLNVAVDTKEAIKIKEKLATIMEARSRSVRVSESQFSEDEEVTIITVDSIGNNLGVVLNCNNNVQASLGFDRSGLIGKNVTKIMPKIYSELHNNFMLRFIRSETSHLRPSDKIITALNKDALLVEMKLTVRMMTSSQSALTIVGFMKQQPKEKAEAEAGLLMFSLNTSEILAIDAQF
jgi:PAS domain S-box-containing protein